MQTPALKRAPSRVVQSRAFDSTRLSAYTPRADDVFIVTYSKCGTTWMQRIVDMMLNRSAEPVAIAMAWFDMRIFGTPEFMAGIADAQTRRRQIKSHCPIDALPIYEGLKYIHVARDGRDAAMSLHNHLTGFTQEARDRFSALNLADPKFGTPMPDTTEDPGEFFHEWVLGEDGAGDPGAGFFVMENSFWSVRRDPNMLLVHYNDLKADLDGEMRRIARFLEIEFDQPLWSQMVEAAGFAAMKRDGPKIIPHAEMSWEGGSQRFLFKGTNGRWQDCVSKADLDAYDARVKAELSPALAKWVEHGRHIAGDPANSAD